MRLTATVVLPAYVEVDVPEDATEEQKRQAILNEADNIFESSGLKAIITECSDPDLEE